MLSIGTLSISIQTSNEEKLISVMVFVTIHPLQKAAKNPNSGKMYDSNFEELKTIVAEYTLKKLIKCQAYQKKH